MGAPRRLSDWPVGHYPTAVWRAGIAGGGSGPDATTGSGSPLPPPGHLRSPSAVVVRSGGKWRGPSSSPKLRAPSGYSSDEDSGDDDTTAESPVPARVGRRSSKLRAPGGLDSDSSDESGEEGGVRRRGVWWRSGAGLRRISHAEWELQQWREQQAVEAQRQSRVKAVRLQEQLMACSLREAEDDAAIREEIRRKHEMHLLQDEEEQRRQMAERQQKLSDEQLRQQRQLKKAEEDLRRVEAAQRAAEEARAAAAAQAAQRAAVAEEEAKRAQEAKKKEEEAAAKAAQEAKVKAAAAATAAAQPTPKAAQAGGGATGGSVGGSGHTNVVEGGFAVRIAPSAREWNRLCEAKLKEALAAIEPYERDEGSKKERRALEKEVNKFVIQISATKDQIFAKTKDLVHLIKARCSTDVQRYFALSMLAKKVLKQCESQVAEKHEFVFALGEVLVHTMAAFPVFVHIMVGHLHRASILTVPKYLVYKKAANGANNDAEYFRRMGYKEFKAEERAAKGAFESTDDFLHRNTAYVLLYAAITQVDVNPHPHGLEHAMEFLGRLTDALPINRTSATVLHAFLKVVGYKMFFTCQSQFINFLQSVHGAFLPELQKSSDPDTKAVCSRLSLYINGAAYKRAPEGREMQQTDESASWVSAL